ncbi:alpha-2-HS-glycoprotein-like isoform X1 [Paramormyrops kingsleyae]|uniref:Si:ch211-262h13.5 n=1 Tax=Paramormyrops kingsleyae TaxID=1676925 RepID=A0A3B3SMI1_9TELE|nr:alpha-2-HS-glycoprotein-like isoform X1 [Paramormyrops kingsleyae]
MIIKMRKCILCLFPALIVSWAQTSDIVPVPCNDKTVEKLSRLALTYVNEDRTVGYKFSLNRILNVHLHAQGPAGKVYYLDLEVLETKCHVGSPKPWKRCDIRPFMETQISGNCNTTILHALQGFSYLHSYDCILIPDQPETLLKTCPDCPLLLPVDSREALQTARLTLRKYNGEKASGSQFRLHSITRASQSTAALGSFVEYTIQETDCTLEQENTGRCQPTDLNGEVVGFCVGAVYDSRDRDIQVSCELFHSQGVEMPKPGTMGGGAGLKKVPDEISAQHQKPTAADAKPQVPKDRGPRPTDSAQKDVVPVGPKGKPAVPIQPNAAPEPPKAKAPTGPRASHYQSSESDSSESSEEASDTVVRPPQDFRYKYSRQKRQVSPNVRPEHIPEFLSLFPSTPSPFRSCPGAPRYTTV